MDSSDIINEIDLKCERIGLGKLKALERAICLVAWLRFEVELGGLSTFYYNSMSRYAPKMVEALMTIGAPKAAQALERANALIRGKRKSWPDREARATAAKRVTQGRWSKIESAMDTDEPESWTELLDSFVDANAASLRETKPKPRRKKT